MFIYKYFGRNRMSFQNVWNCKPFNWLIYCSLNPNLSTWFNGIMCNLTSAMTVLAYTAICLLSGSSTDYNSRMSQPNTTTSAPCFKQLFPASGKKPPSLQMLHSAKGNSSVTSHWAEFKLNVLGTKLIHRPRQPVTKCRNPCRNLG